MCHVPYGTFTHFACRNGARLSSSRWNTGNNQIKIREIERDHEHALKLHYGRVL